MAILRCPYCGEKIERNMKFCSHCGKEIDKPYIDEVDTAFQDIGRIMVKIVAFIIFFFIVMIIVGFIGNLLGFPKYDGGLFIFACILSIVLFLGLGRLF